MSDSNTFIVVMGVSGCGKTTIGKALATRMEIPFYDGDDFHPQSNIDKMESGEPLNDRDRRPWLESINNFAISKINESSLIIACSALKESYRDILTRNISTTFIYLKGSAKLILERLNSREDHFMPSDLLDSQFAALEEPVDAIIIDISQTIEEIVQEAFDQLQ